MEALNLSFLLILLASGALAGLLSGIFGIGGGIISVPILSGLFRYMNISEEHSMRVAIGTSLATIAITVTSGGYQHYKKNNIHFPTVKKIIPFIIAGVLIGSQLASSVSTSTLSISFGLLLLFVAVKMMLERKVKDASNQDKIPKTKPFMYALFLLNGLVSSMTGLSGGFASVPIFNHYGWSIARSVGNASAISICISVPSTIFMIWSGWGVQTGIPFSIGYINIACFASLASMSAVFSPLGVKIAHKLPPNLLKKLFSIMLLIVAFEMLIKHLS